VIAHKEKESLNRAFNVWHRIVLERKLQKKQELNDQKLKMESQAIEKMRLDIQKTQERKELRLKNWENSLKKKRRKNKVIVNPF
jgi:hypothetical protein